MTWKKEETEEIYEVHFFPFIGDLDRWRVYVGNNQKDARKAFKNIVSQWEKKKIIVYDAMAISSKEIEVIIVAKVKKTGLYAKSF